jgi:hyperpolarization activated cyclic nucleotide-gated potassium channel 2
MPKKNGGLRSWSSDKKNETTEEETAVEIIASDKNVNDGSDLRSWSKNNKDSAKVTPEITEKDKNKPRRSTTILKDKVNSVTTKVKKGQESWAKVREYREAGNTRIFRKAKEQADKKKKLGGVFISEIDRTHTITANIDKIRIEQAKQIKHKKDRAREKQLDQLYLSRIPLYRRTINPRNPMKETWDILCLFLVMFSAVEIPLLLAFPDQNGLSATATAIIDWIFIVDVVFCFRTGYELRNGDIEMHSKPIVENYLRTWFPVDFLACFPLELLFVSNDAADNNARVTTLFRLLKMPRLLRLGRLFKYIERFKYAGFMKIIRFILGIILIAHWVGCAFYFIMNLQDIDGRGTWREAEMGLNNQDPIMSRYATLMYAAFKMLIGEGMDMMTPAEKAYGSFVLLLGTVVTAIIVGNVSFVVSNQNSTGYLYQSKIDIVTDEMRALRLPADLVSRTLAYYEYLWNRHRTFDPAGNRFTQDLSPTLRTEILLHMNKDVIVHCSFFRSCSNDCILRLVHSFRYRVFLMDDVITEEGKASQEMVFIIHGNARIMQMGHKMPLGLLNVGDYFGEKSLLMHHRNAVSIIANVNCDTRVLVKRDFEDICIDFPDLRDEITKMSKHNDVTESGNNFRQDVSVGGESTRNNAGNGTKKKKKREMVASSSVSEYSFNSVAGRPASSNQAARLIEVISTVHIMKDTMEDMIQDSQSLAQKVGNLEKKIDQLLNK